MHNFKQNGFLKHYKRISCLRNIVATKIQNLRLSCSVTFCHHDKGSWEKSRENASRLVNEEKRARPLKVRVKTRSLTHNQLPSEENQPAKSKNISEKAKSA